MKIKNLIEELKKYPQDMTVVFPYDNLDLFTNQFEIYEGKWCPKDNTFYIDTDKELDCDAITILNS